MIVSAYVTHSIPGRTRLKIHSQRGNTYYFNFLERHLTECPGVTDVKTSARTGSALVIHRTPFPQIVAFAQTRELFSLLSPQDFTPSTYLQQTTAGFAKLDTDLAELSAGKLDIRSLVLMALMTMSVIQLSRGQIFAPASTLLWYTLELLTPKIPS